MSLLGFDNTGVATLNGLNNINANFVYGDELYYDTSTIPVNVKTAIDGISVDVTTLEGQMITANSNISTLQGQMTTANSNISTLQGQMTTANSNISTLQGQMTTANSNISTLQGQMTTANSNISTLQTDVGVLYGLTATNTASIAGLVISQASQDVIISGHTVSIGLLQAEDVSLDNRIDSLETKTADMSWGSLTGTSFSSKTSVGGGGGVVLNTGSASTFGSGLSSSGNISTTGTLSSTSGTSSVDSLNVNNNFEVTNISYFGDTLFCDRNVLTSKKKIVLYDANTGNDYDYLGFWTDSGTSSKKFLNSEIDGVAGSAFNWYYGNNLGSSRTLAKTLTSADEINYTPQATFLKSSGFSQQIQLVRDTANNRVRIDMLGDTAGLNVYDGQIIQLEGNGVDDNRGTMTIQSGNLTLNALTSATTGTLQMNSKVLDINNSGAITIDGATTTTITSVDDLTLQTTNPFGDILVSSAGASTFTSAGETEINSSILDINASGNVTIDTTNNITTTSGLTTTINANDFLVDTTATLGLTAGTVLQLDAVTIDLTATTIDINRVSGDTNMGNGSGTIDIDGSTLTATTNGGMTFTETSGTMYFNKTGASGGMNFQSANFMTIDAVDEFFATCGGVGAFSSTASTFDVRAYTTLTLQAIMNDVIIETLNGAVEVNNTTTTATTIGNSTGQLTLNAGALDINASGALTIDPLTFTMNSTELTGTAMTWQSNTTGSDLILSNATAGAFSIESGAGQNLIFKTTVAGDLNFDSNGDVGLNATLDMTITAGGGLGITATTGDVGIVGNDDVNITAQTQSVNIIATLADVNLTGTDVTITTTGTSVGEFVVRANTNVDIKTTTGNIELWGNTTMLLKSGGTNTLEVNGADKMVTTSSTTTLTNTNIALTGITTVTGATTVTGTTTLNGNTTVNPDNTFNMMPTATIIQNVSATVPSGFLYCNGQAVSRTVTYARLFASIGTTFGVGNGTTTFNVPDFRGAFLRGASTQTVGGIAYTAGAVGTAQQDMALTTAVSGYSTPLSSTGFRSCGSGTRDCIARTSQGDPIENPTGLNLAYPSGRGGTEVRPFNHAVYYYIRY